MSKTITYPHEPSHQTTIDQTRRLVINYLKLRRYIGFLGVSLPFIMMFGVAVIDPETDFVQDSISSYYYTGVRNVFVGILVAVGVFLHTYKGHAKIDNLLASLAGLCSVLVALVPTSASNPTQETVHLISAAAFFLILAYFSWFLFTKSDQANPNPQKLKRNRIYRICAVIMVLSIASVPVFAAILGDAYFDLNLTFWFEALALWAFGFSWLTKGEAILADA
jgi:hypothetical protein